MIMKHLPSMVRPKTQSYPTAKSTSALLIALIGEQCKAGNVASTSRMYTTRL